MCLKLILFRRMETFNIYVGPFGTEWRWYNSLRLLLSWNSFRYTIWFLFCCYMRINIYLFHSLIRWMVATSSISRRCFFEHAFFFASPLVSFENKWTHFWEASYYLPCKMCCSRILEWVFSIIKMLHWNVSFTAST